MMDDGQINRAALGVVERLSKEFPNERATESLAILSGAMLLISRAIGMSDHELYQGFGAFLEGSAE